MINFNQVHLKAWGNSQGIRIPKEVLQELNLSSKEDVEFNLYVEDQKIILKPIKKISTLQKIFDNFNENYHSEDARHDWEKDVPTGRELF